MTILSVVVLVGERGDPSSVIASSLSDTPLARAIADAAKHGAVTTLIAWSAPARDAGTGRIYSLTDSRVPRVDRLCTALGLESLAANLAKSAIGRLINSLGPLDAGRVFTRRLRSNGAARRELGQADVIIAVDASSVHAAWHASRQRPAIVAVLGLKPALEALRRRAEGDSSAP